MNESNIKVILFLFFIFFSYLSYIQNKNNALYIKYYIENFDYQVSGVVEDLKYINAGSGILYLKNDSIISRTYDPRDSLIYYCCVIQSNKSELVVRGLSDYKKGDHVFINGDKNEIVTFRDNAFLFKKDLTVSIFLPSALEVRWYHKI